MQKKNYIEQWDAFSYFNLKAIETKSVLIKYINNKTKSFDYDIFSVFILLF